MTTPSPEPFRCRRAGWCSEREPVHDPVTGQHLGFIGALLPTADGLCEICRSKLVDALVHLPGDVAELTLLLARPLSVELTEQVTAGKPGPKIPLRDDVEALRALIDHETTSWARSVADDSRVTVNHAQRVNLNPNHTKIGLRVSTACYLLRAHSPVLLELEPVEHRARSLTARRTDGHDEDTATRYGDDIWVHRDGLTGAILLIQLHQRAYRRAARHTTWIREQIPCMNCKQLGLRRPPGGKEARCAHCGHRIGEDSLDVLKTALANSRPTQKLAG